MECENCAKEIPDVVMMHNIRRETLALSELAKSHRLFCSEACIRKKLEEDLLESYLHV